MTKRSLLTLPFMMLACGGSPPQQTFVPAGQGTGTGMCVVIKNGGQFRFGDSEEGVVVSVSAPAQNRADVRSSLRAMATRHEDRRFAVKSSVHHRDALPPHATSLELEEAGARLTYRPLRPEDREKLEQGLRRHLGDLPSRCGGKPASARATTN